MTKLKGAQVSLETTGSMLKTKIRNEKSKQKDKKN